ncbi:MAG TPA: hypothetical protein VKW08_23170 [Xanthobacteraceae bacterium]|jgi:hypothetical protein|nr:hypothetical protein [Xanthobacteraceae bacterium]
MRLVYSVGWGGVTLLGVLLLGANAFWISQESEIRTAGSGILVMQWLLVLASLIIICALAGILTKQRAMGIFIDERNRISLARVQWVSWFLILFSSYFVGSIWDAIFGDLPAIEPNLFGLIGITTGSAVISNLIVDAKKKETATTQQPLDPLVGKIDINNTPAEASWQDLYLGEEEANRYTVDVSRLQKLVATIILVTVYCRMLWLAFTQASVDHEAFTMPVVGPNFIVLLGASHAAYLLNKATPKTVTAAAAPDSPGVK